MLYEGFAYDHAVDQVGNYKTAIAHAARRLGVRGKLGVEPESFSVQLAETLGESDCSDLTPALRRARAVKTEAEKSLMRRSAMAAADWTEDVLPVGS